MDIAYSQTKLLDIQVHGRTMYGVILSMTPQSSSTLWKWRLPEKGLEKAGITRVDFSARETEWQHKCDVSRDVKDSLFKSIYTGVA